MKQYTGYRYRIYPNKDQQLRFAQLFGSVRWVYNYGLNRKKEHYEETQKSLSYATIAHEIVELKKQEETAWLRQANAQSLVSSLRNLDVAYGNFFKGKAKFPKFKSKRHKQTACFPQHSTVSFQDNRLYLCNFNEGIKIKLHRPFPGTIKNVTISHDPSGRYYASILIEEEIEPITFKPLDITKAVGIDLGIKHFAVVSNGVTIDNPKNYKQLLPSLKKHQRRLSRKAKGSQNYKKQKVKLAKVHQKIANRRLDFLHKTTRQLVDDNQVETLCLETLNIKGMKKNHNLAQSVSDCGWNKFVELLCYKAARMGKNVLRVGTWEPTSKTCNDCGAVNRALKLADREWVCPECGSVHDRDFLAACNIRDFAFTVPSERRDFKPVETRVEDTHSNECRSSSVCEAGSPSV